MADHLDFAILQTSMRAESSPASSASSSSDSEDGLVDRVLVLYASETGNAQDCAERVGREFRRKGRRCTVMSMDMFNIVSSVV